MNAYRFVFLFLSVTILGSSLSAKELEFFLSEEPVYMRLEAPVSVLKKQRGQNPEWLQGIVALTDSAGEERLADVKIVARGNFRRKKSSCSFPSYWINFKKKQLKGTALEGLDKVKVVAHCRETRKSFEPYIYKEYLAYKTYNLLTDQSFRVRLAHVEYLDTRNPEKTKTFAAFLIEHVNDFAKRNAAKKVKDRYILPSLYDENALCLAELFQYFVGNCDFSFFASADECCHNGKVFAAEKGKGVYIPVPYDFDMTGLVNVPYAKVNPKLPIKSVTDRYYRGVKASDEIFQETINLFIMKKVEILSLWESSDLLPIKDKKEALDFINEFYSIIEDPIRLENNILKKMRGRDRLEELMIERIENLD